MAPQIQMITMSHPMNPSQPTQTPPKSYLLPFSKTTPSLFQQGGLQFHVTASFIIKKWFKNHSVHLHVNHTIRLASKLFLLLYLSSSLSSSKQFNSTVPCNPNLPEHCSKQLAQTTGTLFRAID